MVEKKENIFLTTFYHKLGIDDRPLTNKEKFTPIIVLVIVFVMTLIGLNPIVSDIYSRLGTLDQKNKELEIMSGRAKLLKSLNVGVDSAQLDYDISNIDKYVPSSKPALLALLNISNLSRLKKVDFSSLDLSPGSVSVNKISAVNLKRETKEETNKQTLDKLEVRFVVKGEKDNLLDFVGTLQEIAPLMKIIQFSTSVVPKPVGVETVDSTIIMQADLQLEAYYLLPPTRLPSLKSKIPEITKEERQFLDSLKNYLFLKEDFIQERLKNDNDAFGKENVFLNEVEAEISPVIQEVSPPPLSFPLITPVPITQVQESTEGAFIQN